MTSTLVQYQNLARTWDRTVETTVSRGEVKRAIDHWRQNIASVKGPDDLIDNPRLYRFAMTAFGLQDQIFAKGLMRKILEEGVTDKEAQANKMTDKRFREFARAFGFAEVGTDFVTSSARMEEVVKKYVTATIETEQGEKNPGVRLAMYFERVAPTLQSWYQVLGDRALSEVVRTVLRLPPQVAQMDLDRYAGLLEDRLDLADFKDPEKRDEFIKRFTILYDMDNQDPFAGGAASGPAALMQPLNGGGRFGPAPIIGLSNDLMLSLASIRRF